MGSLDLDWQSSESHLLLNPATPAGELKLIKQQNWDIFPGHLWIRSSGTMSSDHIKMIALSKESFLNSARSVNLHLHSDSKDVWLNVLPIFHVGGLGVYARAHLTGANLISMTEHSWCPKKFVQKINRYKVTLTSLVPTQVFDLIQSGLSSPRSLRGVIVGGGALSAEIYRKARKLNWPVLPSYGMTETASQIATASLTDLNDREKLPLIPVLSHAKVRISSTGAIEVQTSSLCTAVAEINSIGECTIKKIPVSEWFTTGDIGSYSPEKGLEVYGRSGNVKKSVRRASFSYLYSRAFRNFRSRWGLSVSKGSSVRK